MVSRESQGKNSLLSRIIEDEIRRKRLGGEKRREIEEKVPNSVIPDFFHLGSLLFLGKYPIGEAYPVIDLVYRLTGVQYPDYKSSRYALLYARAISLMKLAKQQKVDGGIWPVNLYSKDLEKFGIVDRVCAELAIEEITDNGSCINPPLGMQLIDVAVRAKRFIMGEFIPSRIISGLEESFSDQEKVRKLERFITLTFPTNKDVLKWW